MATHFIGQKRCYVLALVSIVFNCVTLYVLLTNRFNNSSLTKFMPETDSRHHIQIALSKLREFQFSRDIFQDSGNESLTYIEDIFIAIKTTEKYYKTRLKLLTDTWIPQALNSVSCL